MQEQFRERFDPIQKIQKITDWKGIPIKECYEPLVALNNLDAKIVVDSQYFKRKLRGSSKTLYARVGVAHLLRLAARSLPTSFKLLVWDAWRDTEVQRSLFDQYMSRLRNENKMLDEERLIELTQIYVSLPSIDPQKPSPHLTGGAVDLSILGPNGKLNMGTEFDHFGPESAMEFYEHASNSEIRNNRRFLYHIMTSVGFSGYDEEWWHFDLGNQFDAKRTGKPNAIYGPVKIKRGGDTLWLQN